MRKGLLLYGNLLEYFKTREILKETSVTMH